MLLHMHSFYCFQVYNGRYCSKNGVVQPGMDISALTVDQLVAVQCENCELEPLVAIVERIKQNNVKLCGWKEGILTLGG